MTRLPAPDPDFASIKWAEHNDGNLSGELANCNAYLQAMDDLESGELSIDQVDGKQLVSDLQNYIRKEFREKAINSVDSNNDYHKALYAHCVRRWLQQLRFGVFDGNGRTETRPWIAAAIERHVDKLLTRTILEPV